MKLTVRTLQNWWLWDYDLLLGRSIFRGRTVSFGGRALHSPKFFISFYSHFSMPFMNDFGFSPPILLMNKTCRKTFAPIRIVNCPSSVFQVTFWSPKWRSLFFSPEKGHFKPLRKVTRTDLALLLLIDVSCFSYICWGLNFHFFHIIRG